MGRFRGVSQYLHPKICSKINKKREKEYIMFVSIYSQNTNLVPHLEIAIVGVLALRIAVRMVLGIIN